MKVIYEPAIEPHRAELYAPEQIARYGVAGWDSIHAESLARYAADGFLVVRRALTPEQIKAARSELQAMALADDPACDSICFEAAIQERLGAAEEIENSAGVGSGQFSLGRTDSRMPDLPAEERAGYVRKFMGFTARHPSLRVLAEHPQLLRLLAQIMEDTPRLYQEMAMVKPPQGREKPWHQDHAYFNFPLETRIAGVWFALETVTPENGCMFVVPGAQLAGPRPHFLRRDWQICDSDILPMKRTAVPMEAGDIMLFDSRLPHGTPINRTTATRWAVQYHYVPQKAVEVDDAVRLAAFGSEGKDVSC